MITQGWFMREVLKKDFVPSCPQSPKTDWGQNDNTESRMDKGFRESVPIVPNVPTKKQLPDKFSEQKSSDLEKIRTWLFLIGEPEEDHHLVIDKCKSDSEAMAYFLRHANGEFENSYAVTDSSRPDDRVKCGDCLYLFNGFCQRYETTNHRIKYQPVKGILKRCNEFKPKKGR